MVPVTELFLKATPNRNVLAGQICAVMCSMIRGYHFLPGLKTHHFQELEKLNMRNIFTGMSFLAKCMTMNILLLLSNTRSPKWVLIIVAHISWSKLLRLLAGYLAGCKVVVPHNLVSPAQFLKTCKILHSFILSKLLKHLGISLHSLRCNSFKSVQLLQTVHMHYSLFLRWHGS